jgi:hypothetical protein
MNSKNYAIIYIGNKTIKRKFETASGANYAFPEAKKIELFNNKNQKLATINN